jgi:preprotein translocase subunit SecG
MTAIVLTIHLMIALALVIVVLLQRSEGGGLGIGGGGGGGMGSFMSARGTANLLTRTTAILAACFMSTSILLAIVDRPAAVDTAPAKTGPAAPVSQ